MKHHHLRMELNADLRQRRPVATFPRTPFRDRERISPRMPTIRPHGLPSHRRLSPAPGTGSGYSSTFRTSGPPYSFTTIAFIYTCLWEFESQVCGYSHRLDTGRPSNGKMSAAARQLNSLIYGSTTILPPALLSSIQRCASTISSSRKVWPSWTFNIPAPI